MITHESEDRATGRSRFAKTWDARPCGGATLGHLDLDLELVATDSSLHTDGPSRLSISEKLSSLRLFDLHEGCVTNAAILLFGKAPHALIPGAYVRYFRYPGTEKVGEPLDERLHTGALSLVLRRLEQLFRNLGTGLSRCEEYPARALHELFANALIHRNYEGSADPILVTRLADRLEILSPGGLSPDLDLSLFPRGTAYRNSLLAEAARILGLACHFGRGVAVAQAELARHRSSAMRFEISATHFLVTVPAHHASRGMTT